MCGAPSAPKPPSERDIAVQTRGNQLRDENVKAGKGRDLSSRQRLQAKSDPQFKEVGVDKKTITERSARRTRRASKTGTGGSTLATSALGLGGGSNFGASVLTGSL